MRAGLAKPQCEKEKPSWEIRRGTPGEAPYIYLLERTRAKGKGKGEGRESGGGRAP